MATTSVAVHCPIHGDYDVPATAITVMQCSVPTWSYYTWHCPPCGHEHRVDLTTRVSVLLHRAGAVFDRWVIPLEALEDHHGPPIRWDDVLDFTAALAALPTATHTEGDPRG